MKHYSRCDDLLFGRIAFVSFYHRHDETFFGITECDNERHMQSLDKVVARGEAGSDNQKEEIYFHAKLISFCLFQRLMTDF